MVQTGRSFPATSACSIDIVHLPGECLHPACRVASRAARRFSPFASLSTGVCRCSLLSTGSAVNFAVKPETACLSQRAHARDTPPLSLHRFSALLHLDTGGAPLWQASFLYAPAGGDLLSRRLSGAVSQFSTGASVRNGFPRRTCRVACGVCAGPSTMWERQMCVCSWLSISFKKSSQRRLFRSAAHLAYEEWQTWTHWDAKPDATGFGTGWWPGW
jgi:hypothetical protein